MSPSSITVLLRERRTKKICNVRKKQKRGHLEILKEAVKEPGKEFTSQQVANSLGVSLNADRGYLKNLVEKDLLILAATKRNRTIRHLSPADLGDKLQVE